MDFLIRLKIARKSCSVCCLLFSTILIILRVGWKVNEPNQPKCIILLLLLTQQKNKLLFTSQTKENSKFNIDRSQLPCDSGWRNQFCYTWWNVVIFSWLIGWAAQINDVRSDPYKNKNKNNDRYYTGTFLKRPRKYCLVICHIWELRCLAAL